MGLNTLPRKPPYLPIGLAVKLGCNESCAYEPATVLATLRFMVRGSLDFDQFHGHLATCGICRAILRYLAGTADIPVSGDE